MKNYYLDVVCVDGGAVGDELLPDGDGVATLHQLLQRLRSKGVHTYGQLCSKGVCEQGQKQAVTVGGHNFRWNRDSK